MKRFSMSWENDINRHRNHNSLELPESWESDNLMSLVNIAKKKKITSDVYLTEWDTEEIDDYELNELVNQVSMTEVLDYIEREGSINDLQVI